MHASEKKFFSIFENKFIIILVTQIPNLNANKRKKYELNLNYNL